MSFPHLRVRSSYSLLRGASDIASLVKQAALYGVPAMALSDHDNLFGALEFSNKCMKAGIQPVMSLRARMFSSGGKGGYSTFIAADEKGFSGICSMVKALGAAPTGTPERKVAGDVTRISRDVMKDFSEGVICLWGGGDDGSMNRLSAEEMKEEFSFLKNIFGTRLYGEICRIPGEGVGAAEKKQIEFCINSGLPMVGTVDVWYAEPEQHRAWVLLRAMSAEPRQEILFTDDGMVDAGEPVHCLCDDTAARELFSDIPEAYRNAESVARRCSFAARGRPPMLPPFPCENSRTEAEELREQAEFGLKLRLDKRGITGENCRKYFDRLAFETGIIERMGFPGYFLIVSDFIRWARDHDIPVGPGRGSGAGSVVAWALGITDLDPLEFGLLFERFLNPDRISMPDFDVDFCEDRRDEVIQYVREKYGDSNVAYIATFQVIKGKSALRDTHRVVRHDKLGAAGLRDIDYVSKLIPKKEDAAEPMGLEEAYEKVTEFREAVSASGMPTISMVYELAKEVEGLMKSRGLHAAGVVISDRPLETLIPVLTDEKTGASVSGYSLKGVEEAGLVKFDFLGLTTLSILKEACNHIRSTCGFDIDLSDLPRDDPAVMADLSKGDATGVFQFETGGMRKTMRQVKPTCLEDLIAIVSLFRPGPMQYIEDYAARKSGRSFEYPGGAARTEVYLKETYGIMVYQEQVMQVAQACAGYSLGEADLLRRAMGKKQKAEMDRQRDTFIKGCIAGTSRIIFEDRSSINAHSSLKLPSLSDPNRKLSASEALQTGEEINYPGYIGKKIVSVDVNNDGFSAEQAVALFDDIDRFASYGFNKSHAAAYALIGYQTAWVRKFFPAEFYAALMTYGKKPEKRGMVKDDMTRHGIELLPPDINKSFTRFRPEMDGKELCVRYGFCGIKGLPENMDWVDEERRKNGNFRSLKDFHSRNRKRLKKDHLQILAAMGAFSEMMPVRSQAADILRQFESMDTRSDDLFGASDIRSDISEWPDIPEREFAAAGFYMSGHPLDTYLERLASSPVRTRNWWRDKMKEIGEERVGGRLLCVLVREIGVKQSKNGSSFLQVRVSDREDTFQMNCFTRGDDGETDIKELREVLTAAMKSNMAVIVDCDLSLSADGEQVWVNGNAAMSYKEYFDSIDKSRDTVLIRLSPTDGTSAEDQLNKNIARLEELLATARDDNDPAGTVSIILVCSGLRAEVPGRYPYDRFKAITTGQMSGILSTRYVTGNPPAA